MLGNVTAGKFLLISVPLVANGTSVDDSYSGKVI